MRGQQQRCRLAETTDRLQQQQQPDADDRQGEQGGRAVAPGVPLPQTGPEEGQETGAIGGTLVPNRGGDGWSAQVGRKSSTASRLARLGREAAGC